MLARVVGPILCVVGARPNFMKITPVIRAMNGSTPPLPVRLLHTGQHYDPEMNSQYFQGLGIPDTNTVVGSSPEHILAAVDDILRTGGKAGRGAGAVGRPGVPAHRGRAARMARSHDRAAGGVTPNAVKTD